MQEIPARRQEHALVRHLVEPHVHLITLRSSAGARGMSVIVG